MGFLNWLAHKYNGKQVNSDNPSIKPDMLYDSPESCITKCKFAVLDNRNYFCFSKNVPLTIDSIPNGCSYYKNKTETFGNIRCPICENDLIEQVQGGRFKCTRCGKIFS